MRTGEACINKTRKVCNQSSVSWKATRLSTISWTDQQELASVHMLAVSSFYGTSHGERKAATPAGHLIQINPGDE